MQTTRIQKYYNNVIVEDLILILNCQNIMELPEMSRISLSTSSKSFGAEKQEIINAFAIYFLLSGQKGVSTRARNSIAAFGVRKDSIIGCLVTLRKERLYALFDKIISFVLPRERIQMNANKLLSIKFCDSKKSIQSRTFVAPLSVRDSRLPSSFALDEDLSFSSSSGLSKALDQFRDQGEWNRKKTREFHFGISQSKSFPEVENMFERFGSSLGLNISFSIKTSKLQNMFWPKAGMLAEHSSACGAQAFTYANASDAFALRKQSQSMHLLPSASQHIMLAFASANASLPQIQASQTESKYSICKPMHSVAMQAKLVSAKRDISQKHNSNFTIFSKSVFKKDIPKIYDKDLLFLSAFQFPCT